MNSENFAVFIWIGLMLLGVYGWVVNIITLCNMSHFSGMVVVRAIGVFIAPLGAVLGWL